MHMQRKKYKNGKEYYCQCGAEVWQDDHECWACGYKLSWISLDNDNHDKIKPILINKFAAKSKLLSN